jgi:DNA processing protein
MEDLKYWVALSTIPHLGAARFRRLESYFDSMERAWSATSEELRQSGLDSRAVQEVVSGRERLDPDAMMASLARASVTATNWNGSDYPTRLKQISDPPPVMYYTGEMKEEDEWSVAVVGTRRPTAYGRKAAAVLSRDLASSGITVVSGLALGIDGVAHSAALECGGRTVAVVAGGLDSVYPKEHASLFRQIQEWGAVVSEHPLGVRPDPRSFPRRNRLISGMTLGTVVVEAAEGSGTRWTVYQALEQNREVFCVPGDIFSPASRFTNRMIKEGAKLVADYTDILEELNLPSQAASVLGNGAGPMRKENQPIDKAEEIEIIDIDEGEAALLAHLAGEPVHVDDLCRESGLPIATITSMLTLLEFKGIVEQVGSMHYVKASAAGVTHGS